MNRFKYMLAVLGCLAAVCLTATDASAQAGGGFGGAGGAGGAGGGRGGRRGGNGGVPPDPAAIRQQQLDNYKTALEVTDDSEWTVLSTAVGKVLDAQNEVRSSTPRGGPGGRGGRGGRGGAAAAGGAAAGGAAAGGRQRGGFNATPNPDVEALQAAIDNKAGADEIKEKLAKVRDSLKSKDAALEAARGNLRSLLSTRQEAIAVLDGLLD